MKKILHVGDVYGQLTVLGQFRTRKGGQSHYWYQFVVRCSCGKVCVVHRSSVRSGDTASCGCLQSASVAARSFKHGDAHKNGMYNTWTQMRARCRCSTHQSYRHYGGRGIKVCEEWQTFEGFRAWALANGWKATYVKGKPKTGLELDRIDADGDYEPANCQWLTASENASKMARDRREKVARLEAEIERLKGHSRIGELAGADWEGV